MNKLYNILFGVSLALSLSSCSYIDRYDLWDRDEDSFFSSASSEDGNISVRRSEIAPSLAGVSEQYAQGVAIASKGSVQLFSLDDPSVAPQVTPSAAQPLKLSPPHRLGQRPLDFAASQARLSSSTSASAVSSRSFQSPEFAVVHHGSGDPVVIYFNHDSVFLNDADRRVIARIARSGVEGDLLVEGHASVVSSLPAGATKDVVNLKVSMDRAFAVAKVLIENGVPASHIQTRAYGDTQPPVNYDRSLDRNSAARRVEVSHRR